MEKPAHMKDWGANSNINLPKCASLVLHVDKTCVNIDIKIPLNNYIWFCSELRHAHCNISGAGDKQLSLERFK